MANKLQTLNFGPLPATAINQLLGLELEEGKVIMTESAQNHANFRHPLDYGKLLPHVAQVVARPLYIGDDLKNPNKMELVSKIPALGMGLLIAVNLEMDEHGRYQIHSFYPISEKKIQSRLAKNHLMRFVP